MKFRDPPISEQLRKEIRNHSEPRARICEATGISPASLSKFMSKTAGLSQSALDKLAEYLGLYLETYEDG